MTTIRKEDQYDWRINLHKDLIELLIELDSIPSRILYQGHQGTASSNIRRYQLDPIYRNKIDSTAAGIQVILSKYVEGSDDDD